MRVPADHEGELKVLATNSLEPELFSGCMFDDLFSRGTQGGACPRSTRATRRFGTPITREVKRNVKGRS
jgi:hypothetical protein